MARIPTAPYCRAINALDSNGVLMTQAELEALLHGPNMLHDAQQKITDEERFLKLVSDRSAPFRDWKYR